MDDFYQVVDILHDSYRHSLDYFLRVEVNYALGDPTSLSFSVVLSDVPDTAPLSKQNIKDAMDLWRANHQDFDPWVGLSEQGLKLLK